MPFNYLAGIILNIFFLLFFPKFSTHEVSQAEVGKHAMVVCAHAKASQIGLDVIKKGGNAVDAAVAVGFALAVCYPNAGNIGGGGFMVMRFNDGKTDALDYRETAPAAANRDMYLDKQGVYIRKLSTETHLACGVPGSVDGMLKAHEKYGKLPLKDLIDPAIKLARFGFLLSARQANSLNDTRQDFINRNCSPLILVRNKPWKQGDTLIQEDLAKTLELIRDKGRDGFYTGETADKIVAEMNRGNGIITLDDLKNYSSKWRTPIMGNYKEYKIISMPPPSSGGLALLQMTKMLEAYPIDKWGAGNIKTIHVMIEIERRAYADRAKYLGDPDFYSVPIDKLLNAEYLKNRMTDYNANVATLSVALEFPVPLPFESRETTHYSIVDENGNAVACTTTLNGNYGSRIFVNGAGFLLNNEMDDFSAKPGIPNMFGLVGEEANAIHSHKRMLSSMTPTILERKGRLFMVIGSPGGAHIINSVFETIINVIEYKMAMQKAVDTKRYHHQWKPDVVEFESGSFDGTIQRKLISMGHRLKEVGSFGRVDAILVRDDGTLEGGADSRGEDQAKGY